MRIALLSLALILPCATATCQGLSAKNTCRFSFDDDPLPNCLIESNGHVYVAPEYRARLDFSRKSLSPTAARYGLAFMMSDDHGLSYVDRKGKVVVSYVAEFDNGPSDFKYGLVRVYVGTKMNFADPRGQLAFAGSYDYVTPFWHGRAYGCVGCRHVCMLATAYCEMGEDAFVGGRWFGLTADGKASPIDPGHMFEWMFDPGIASRPTIPYPNSWVFPKSGVN